MPTPAGFAEVSPEAFFANIGPRNIHPRPEKTRSEWVDQSTRALIGISTPGYLCQDEHGVHTAERHYYLRANG